jgi:hypothetical protein
MPTAPSCRRPLDRFTAPTSPRTVLPEQSPVAPHHLNRTRKSARIIRRRSSVPRFNGAAARRPRKYACDGRARLKAPASMGPRSEGRGKATNPNMISRRQKLQRGRGFKGRGTDRAPCRRPIPLAGFNGAAVPRPRKSELAELEKLHRWWLQRSRGPKAAEIAGGVFMQEPFIMLQWGRDPKTAGMLRHWTVLAYRIPASMGPRSGRPREYTPHAHAPERSWRFVGAAGPVDRGIGSYTGSVPDANGLQLGRGSKAAEIGSSTVMVLMS